MFQALCLSILHCWVGLVVATPVDINHSVYGFLRRLEIKGTVTSGSLGSLPLSRSDVGQLLTEAAQNSGSLSTWEKRRLTSYLHEWNLIETESEHFQALAYHDSNFKVQLGASFEGHLLIQDSLPKAQTFMFGFLSGNVGGSYKEKLQFLSSAGLGQQRSLHKRFIENYDPQRGMPYNTDRLGKAGITREVSSLDAFRTVVGYEEKSFRLEFGSDWNQWGPGIWQHASVSPRPWFWVQDSLAANDSLGYVGTKSPGAYRIGYRNPGETAPMTQLRLSGHVGRFRYTKIVAERMGLWADTMAHFIAHRLEFKPCSFLGLGLEEMVVTSGRTLDWTYIIPLVPIKYAEHQLGDRDNIAVGFDVETWIATRGRLFGELILDDFSGWDLNFWGAKYAYSLGGEWTGIPTTASLLQAEYAHVEPWVFTHHLRNNQFQHFGSLLGSSLPPNSQSLRLAWQQPTTSDLDFRLEYMFMERDVSSRGSSVFNLHQLSTDGTQKVFLGGIVETRHILVLGTTWRWKRFSEVSGQLGFLQVDNWKSQSGKGLSSPIIAITTLFHY